jgi:hypothetical protein
MRLGFQELLFQAGNRVQTNPTQENWKNLQGFLKQALSFLSQAKVILRLKFQELIA